MYRYYKVWRSSAYAESYLDEEVERERKEREEKERATDLAERARKLARTKQRKKVGWHE